jgi:threonine dehydrogenase-like Zn-dependent dehydrogenase
VVEVCTAVPVPRVEAPGDAVVRVLVAGLCGSDLHPFTGAEPCDAGCTFGHEVAGEVVEVGADVTAVAVGDTVVASFTTACGACWACECGLSARCVHNQLLGWRLDGRGLHGAQAQFVRVPHANGTLLRVPLSLRVVAGAADTEGAGGEGGRTSASLRTVIAALTRPGRDRDGDRVLLPRMAPEVAMLAGDILSTAMFAALNAGCAGHTTPATVQAAMEVEAAALALAHPGAGVGDAAAALLADFSGVAAFEGAAGWVYGAMMALEWRHAVTACVSTAASSTAHASTPRPRVLVVVGCGPVGLLTVYAARQLLSLADPHVHFVVPPGEADGDVAASVASCPPGSSPVFLLATDTVPARLEAAAALGAWAVPAGEACVRAVRRAAACAGRPAGGADAVMECSGASAALASAFRLLRPGGVLSSIGVNTSPTLPFTPAEAYDANVTFRTGRCPARSLMPAALAVLAACDASAEPLAVDRVISHRLPLADAAEGYRMFGARQPGCTKVVFVP